MIASLELPYRGGLAAVKVLLNEIKLSPVTERSGWPEVGDVFLADASHKFTFVDLVYNEVQEPFFIFRCEVKAADWINRQPGGHKWSYEEASDAGYCS